MVDVLFHFIFMSFKSVRIQIVYMQVNNTYLFHTKYTLLSQAFPSWHVSPLTHTPLILFPSFEPMPSPLRFSNSGRNGALKFRYSLRLLTTCFGISVESKRKMHFSTYKTNRNFLKSVIPFPLRYSAKLQAQLFRFDTQNACLKLRWPNTSGFETSRSTWIW